MDYELIREAFQKAAVSVNKDGVFANYVINDDYVRIDEDIEDERKRVFESLIAASRYVMFKCDSRVFRIGFSISCDVERPMIYMPLEYGVSKEEADRMRAEISVEMENVPAETRDYFLGQGIDIDDWESVGNAMTGFIDKTQEPVSIEREYQWPVFSHIAQEFHMACPQWEMEEFEPDVISFSPADEDGFTQWFSGVNKDRLLRMSLASKGFSINIFNDDGKLVFGDIVFGLI